MVDLDHAAETWGLGTAGAFVALAVFNFVPVVNLIRLVPTFKEILIGAGVVVFLLETTDPADGAAYALVVGMVAAVAVNLVGFVLTLVGVSITQMLGTGMGAGMGMSGGAGVAAVGAVVRFVGVVLFSPVGYAVGGAVGAWLNGRDEENEEGEGGRERPDDETPAGDAEWEPTR